MNQYIVLIRGINVGVSSKVSMATLRELLEDAGYTDMKTYINSGNVLLRTTEDIPTVKTTCERILAESFTLRPNAGRVHILSTEQLADIVANKPNGFGEQPTDYHSDAIFLMGIDAEEAFSVFSPKEGVDTVWKGDGVIYSQRLSELRTKSRLNKVMSSPVYKNMTIRTWQTTIKLLELAQAK